MLSNFSKFFEKVICNRSVEFAEKKNDILYRCQFGFRKNHSTSYALIHLVNKIASAIDQHETTVGVFLDLSKVFDTLDHQILFAKLEHYYMRDAALQWFKSYFSCRQQFVQFNQACLIMFRSRFFLSSTTKPTLYHTLIYPYIVYCNCAWSSTYVSNLNRIYYLQKRAVRAITNSDYRAHSAPLFSKLGILDIFQVNTFEIAKFMFYYRNNLLPPLLPQSFCNE